MSFIAYIIAGIFGGLLGGMGMGGGTVLIPILTLLFSINQHTSQAINLIAFIPMAVFALYVHLQNKLINVKNIYLIILPAILFSVVGSFIAKSMQGDSLQKLFGAFLIILSLIQFFCKTKGKNKE
jgi:hypothetical protein